MKNSIKYYNEAEALINRNIQFKNEFNKLVNYIENIEENEIISFKRGKFYKSKSISQTLNYILDTKLTGIGYDSKFHISKKISKKSKWAIDYKSENILISVCFKHNLMVTNELLKLDLGVNDKTNPELLHCNLGILITITDSMKSNGGFDNSVITSNQIDEEFQFYKKIFKSPLVVIGIDQMEKYSIDKGGIKPYVKEK